MNVVAFPDVFSFLAMSNKRVVLAQFRTPSGRERNSGHFVRHTIKGSVAEVKL